MFRHIFPLCVNCPQFCIIFLLGVLWTELCSPSHPIPDSCVKVLNPNVLVLGTEIIRFWRFPSRLRRKEYAWCRKADLTPGLGRSPGEGNGYPLQCSCLAEDWTEDPGGLSSMGSQQRRGTVCHFLCLSVSAGRGHGGRDGSCLSEEASDTLPTPWSWSSQPPTLWEIISCCFGHSSTGFSYRGPNRPSVVNKINKPANFIVLS